MNGEPAPILVANHALRAVMVSRGTSTLKFVHGPSSFILGLVLCALAAALLSVGLVIVSRRGRRDQGDEHQSLPPWAVTAMPSKSRRMNTSSSAEAIPS